MCDLVDQEPTNYEEAIHKKEWVEVARTVVYVQNKYLTMLLDSIL